MLTERENMLLVLEGKQPEWIPNYGIASIKVSPNCIARKLDPKTGYMVDACGVEFAQEIDGLTPVHTKDRNFTMKDVTEWRNYLPKIDLRSIDWEQDVKASLNNRYSYYGDASGNDKITDYVFGYLWDELHYLMGFENALCALIEEPECCYDFFQALADIYIEVFHNYCKYWKPDVAMLVEHIANNRGMLMNPDTYREIIKPAEKKVYDAIIAEGVYPEIHTDGDFTPVIDDYAEIGIKVIQPFQIYNDIEGAKKKHGIICIGGWDSFGPGNVPDATEEDIRQSVRLAMDTYGKTNRYAIYFSGCTARNPERMRILADEAEKYGHAFFNK